MQKKNSQAHVFLILKILFARSVITSVSGFFCKELSFSLKSSLTVVKFCHPTFPSLSNGKNEKKATN